MTSRCISDNEERLGRLDGDNISRAHLGKDVDETPGAGANLDDATARHVSIEDQGLKKSSKGAGGIPILTPLLSKSVPIRRTPQHLILDVVDSCDRGALELNAP